MGVLGNPLPFLLSSFPGGVVAALHVSAFSPRRGQGWDWWNSAPSQRHLCSCTSFRLWGRGLEVDPGRREGGRVEGSRERKTGKEGGRKEEKKGEKILE